MADREPPTSTLSAFSTEDVPVFAPHLRAVFRGEGAGFLIGERQQLALSGPHTLRVAMLIDGSRTLREILGCAAEVGVPAPQVAHTLDGLRDAGLLCKYVAGDVAAQAFAHALDQRPLDPCNDLQATVRSCGAEHASQAASWMRTALLQTGVSVLEEAQLHVVVCEDYLNPALAEIYAECVRQQQDMLVVKPVGVMGLLGPLFSRDTEACWYCLRHALGRQRPVEGLLATLGVPMRDPPVAALEGSVRAVCGMAAVATRNWLARKDGASSPLSNAMVSYDFESLQGRTHTVIRRPQCDFCGQRGMMAVQGLTPVELASTDIVASRDNGYRCEDPMGTYARLEHLVDPLLGPVSYVSVSIDPARPDPLPAVYVSAYCVTPHSEVPGRGAFDRICAGKGGTLAQSRMSALGEALERYCGRYQGDEAVIVASYEELAGQAIAPDALQLFSAAQLAKPTPRGAGGERVPERLPDEEKIAWTPAWSLHQRGRRYVPLAYCYEDAPGKQFALATSNGSAAGSCIEEALLQGLFELVERDALAIWWYNRLPRPALAACHAEHPSVAGLRARLAESGMSTWLVDLTHDLDIPVVAAVGRHDDDGRLVFGFGCHLGVSLAAQRALTELIQVVDPAQRRAYPWAASDANEHAFAFPTSPLPASAERASFPPSDDMKRSLEYCLLQLARADIEVLAVNKSRPDVPLSVVQVIAPGLRHVWPRFAPGRLYRVPVDLGWRTIALAEHELNPKALLI